MGRGGNEGEEVCNQTVGFEQGPARMGIRYHGQRADIPSKGLFNIIYIYVLNITIT
jgi:hypothetical protein